MVLFVECLCNFNMVRMTVFLPYSFTFLFILYHKIFFYFLQHVYILYSVVLLQSSVSTYWCPGERAASAAWGNCPGCSPWSCCSRTPGLWTCSGPGARRGASTWPYEFLLFYPFLECPKMYTHTNKKNTQMNSKEK